MRNCVSLRSAAIPPHLTPLRFAEGEDSRDSVDTDPQSQFVRQSRQFWGAEVNCRTALAYNATKALTAAMQKSPTREGIQQTLASTDFSTPGAANPVQFLPSGDSNAPVQLVRVVRQVNASTGYDFVPVRQ